MMNADDLDQLIDAAADQMVGREPSRSLSYAVMARVREQAAPASRSFVWVSATAGAVVLSGVVALVTMNQPIAPPVVQTPARQESRLVAPPEPIVRELPRQEPTRPVRPRVASALAQSPVRMLPMIQAAPSIEPLEPEGIVLASIDVSPIATQTTSIERIEIDDLTIEPLAASND